MITSIFRKSTPLNYALVILLTITCFFIYQSAASNTSDEHVSITVQIGILIVIIAMLAVSNFMVKRNDLSRDSSYCILFFLLFLLFFPSLFTNLNLILSGFFILLSLRRLLSLHSLKNSKEKIFDASIWIFVAAVFHFWSIIFIGLVFIAILFHAANDYRNWILPFLAFASITAAFLLVSFVFDRGLIEDFYNNSAINVRIDYFTSVKQNVALSVYASVSLFFVGSMLSSLKSKPLLLQSAYKKIIAAFLLGIVIYILSPAKSNDVLIFTIAPLAVMATSHIEIHQELIKREIVLALLIICSFFLFFYQL